jgi:hypothetical protein
VIYGRAGQVVHIVRRAVFDDVRRLDQRRATRADKAALEQGSFWVVRNVDNGSEQLYHLAYLRADGGAAEITAACEFVATEKGPTDVRR